MKKILLTLSLVATMASTALAEEAFFDFRDPNGSFGYTQPTADAKQVNLEDDYVLTVNNVKMTADRGSSTSKFRFYWNILGITYRYYLGETTTFTAPEGTVITKVLLTTWQNYINSSSPEGTVEKTHDGTMINTGTEQTGLDDPSEYTFTPTTPVQVVNFQPLADDAGKGLTNYWFTATVTYSSSADVAAIEENSAKVVAGNGAINVDGDANDIKVYTAGGALVSSNETNVNVASGLYLVKVDGKVSKVIVK